MASRCLFILLMLLTYGTLAAPPATAGPPQRLVSVIMAGNLPRHRQAHQAFIDRLAQLPKIPGLQIYVQTPNPDPLSLANSVRKAVAFQADLIVVYGAQAALVARKENRNAPVLFADVFDPVALGLVRCIEDVACDLSGISANTPLQTLLKAFSAINPGCRRVGLLYSSNDAGSVLQCETLENLAAKYGFATRRYDVRLRADLPAALQRLETETDALFLSDSALVQQQAEAVMSFANAHRLPVFSQVPGLGDLGAMLTLEPHPEEQGSRLGDYAHAVLTGQSARDLPVVTPKKVDLVINLQVVRSHDLKVPFETLSLATRVIK